MGVEKEKLDTSIIMDEDEYNLSIEPILMKKGKVYSEAPDRDPNEINTHLKQVGFEDVIGEPSSAHSFDRVWIGSHATFELVKFFFYRLLTTLLAVPMAFTLGLLFGVLSCVHVWLVMPVVQSFMMLLPSAQKIWRSLTDIFIAPLFQSLGKCLSSIQIQTPEN
ncbi:caveolin-2 isoform X1 [Xiphophorus hellerii]|uniref:caveolin-2 isoform X1 n=1 Tax=Xiphophorus hellerii TaxID=8084 RepID=UPI0013B3ACBE|nr:caveolin-2 isoform X1 [Xiphophorus hellerii]